MFSANRGSTGAFSCSLPPGNAVKGGNISKLVVFTLVLLRQKFHWWKQLGGACYFSPVKLGVRVSRKRAMPRRIGDCSWSPRCSRLPQCLVQVSESCSSGPLCCPWQIPAMPTAWGDQLQRGSGAQYFTLPKEPIAVCVRKPDGSVSLLAL